MFWMWAIILNVHLTQKFKSVKASWESMHINSSYWHHDIHTCLVHLEPTPKCWPSTHYKTLPYSFPGYFVQIECQLFSWTAEPEITLIAEYSEEKVTLVIAFPHIIPYYDLSQEQQFSFCLLYWPFLDIGHCG